MNKIIVEQYRSVIRNPAYQREQLKTLGLRGIGKRKELIKSDAVLALIKRLPHLVRVIDSCSECTHCTHDKK